MTRTSLRALLLPGLLGLLLVLPADAGPHATAGDRGTWQFVDVTAAAGIVHDYVYDPTKKPIEPRWICGGAAAGDVDDDGDVDLYLVGGEFGANTLYLNRGDGTFEDASLDSGIGAVAASTLGVISGDFDDDGRTDFYAANDQMPNHLWINQGDGSFQDNAVLGGAAVNADGLPEASMGVAAGDIDGDGSEDLMVTHLLRETNTLYLNDGGGYLYDATAGSGLGPPSFGTTGFGIALTDLDLDGWSDLVIVNGAVRRIQEQVRLGEPHPLRQKNQVFRNREGRGFEELPSALGELSEALEVSRAAVAGDVDNDGDPDVLVTNNAGPARLLVNETVHGHEWLGLNVLRGGPRGFALGSRVEIVAGDRKITGRVRTDGSYVSARDPRLTIGTGSAPIDSIRVEWAGGGVTRWEAPPAGRFLTLIDHRSEGRR